MESGTISTLEGLKNQLAGLKPDITLSPPVRVIVEEYDPDNNTANITVEHSH